MGSSVRFLGHRTLHLGIIVVKIKLCINIQIQILLLVEGLIFVIMAIQKRINVEIFGPKSLSVHVTLLFAI